MIIGMNHFTVIAQDPEKTLQFYTQILGLKQGPRPPLGFAGAWLYADLNQSAILHIYFDRPVPQPPAGVIDHMAFTGSDLEGLKARLEAHHYDYKVQLQAGGKTLQLFTHDPSGARVEVDFIQT
jgi:catechol 2,3-dioxygenase-like lactoylglutathione lyase family enzyme